VGIERLAHFTLCITLCLACLLGGSMAARAQAATLDTAQDARHGAEAGLEDRPRDARQDGKRAVVDLRGRIKDIELVERDGSLYVRVEADSPPISADLWLRALHSAQADQRERGFLYVLFNITKPWSFVWIAVGFAGQALFTLRMVLQWYASEKEKRSVIPIGFWWGSLFGGILLLVYFVWRRDIVGIVGQSTGIFVYARNLVLIHRRHATVLTPAVPAN